MGNAPSVQLLRTEGIEDCFLAFWRKLEHDATATIRVVAVGGPAVLGRPIQVSLLVEDQPGLRQFAPSGAVVLRTEAVKYRVLAVRSELEYDAPSVDTALGRPIRVSLLVEDQSCCGG